MPQGAWAADAQASRYYEDALKRYRGKDMPGAIIQLKNALKLDKTQLSVQLLLGQALLANSEVVAAEVALTEALRLGADRSVVVLPLAKAMTGQARPDVLLEDPRFDTAGLPADVAAQLLLLKAAAYGDQDKLREALRGVEQARALAPAQAQSWLTEVPLRVRARQFDAALAAADQALRLEPASADALYLRGSVSHAMGDGAEAMAWYTQALAREPDHADALLARAGLWVDTRRDKEALADLQALATADPRDPRAAYLRALIQQRRGDAASSKASLHQVVALVDAVPIAFLRYRPQILLLGGLAHHGLGEREKALPYLEAVVRQQPVSPAAKLLAQVHLALGNTDRAIEALDGYRQGFPNDWQATYLLASAHLSQGRHTRAAALMTDALRHTDTPAARGVLGLSLLAGGQFSNAEAELAKAVAREPGQVPAAAALVGIYMHSGRGTEAVRVAKALAAAHPRSPGIQSLLGSAWLAARERVPARQAFNRARELDPKFLEPLVRLAGMDLDERKIDTAVAQLNRVIASDPDNLDALMMLAGAFVRVGKPDEAQRWLQRADDVAGPDNVQAALALVEFQLARNRPDLAKAALPRAEQKQPQDLSVLIAAARVALATDDDSGARSTLSRASALAGTQAARLVQIAQLQVQAGDLPGAAHGLAKVLKERPDFLPALALMTDVDIAQRDYAAAEARARQVLARHPKLGLGHSLLGDLSMARGKNGAAVESYVRAHQLESSSQSLLRLFRAQVRVEPVAAHRLAGHWLKAHPGDIEVRREQARSFARKGDMLAAKTAFEGLVQHAPDDVEALNNLANVLVHLKDPGALAVAERALARAPETAHVIGTAGWAAYHAGQADRALTLLRNARLRDPDNSQTRYFLATVLVNRGRQAEARSELEAALRGGLPADRAQDARQLLSTLN